MAAWLNVWMKEWRLGRKFMYGVLILMVVLAVAAIGFGVNNPYGIVSLLYGSGVIMVVFYLMAYLIVSFANEKNSFSIWMQTPLPGWSLIAAKVLAGIVSMLITIAAAILLTLAVDAFDGDFSLSGLIEADVPLTESDLADIQIADQLLNDLEHYKWQITITLIPALFTGALIIGAIYLVFYMANQTLRRWIGRWSRLAAIFVTIAAIWIMDKLFESPIIDLFVWGSYTLAESPLAFDGDMLLIKTIPAGVILLSMLILGLVVYAAGWLLDKKVEVR